MRKLFTMDMNEYQDPTWVQAAELFDEVVVPCESYHSEGFYTLGIDIVKEAEKHGCKEAYQKIPGMYNVKLASGQESSKGQVEEFDYSATMGSIKEWIARMKDWF